ncbi:hypothetical protein FBU30_005940 [Linnemannia zychae]|nr:hypothetical protein FBU30_005940 [Linnemannia zychae]
MKVLDDFTSGAVQELTAIHKQAKAHSDQLLSVQALAKQAQTTTTLLHGIINKLNLLSDALPTDVGTLGITESKYPYLYQYIHQTPEHYGHMGTKGTKTGTSSENWSSPIGLTLLGQKTSLLNKRPIATITSTSTTGISASATNRGYPHQHHNHMSSRTSGIAIPKARASMALASDPLNFLPLQSTSLSDLDSTFGGLSMDGNGLLSVSPVPRPLSADIIHEASSTRNGHGTALLPQQRTQTASDNLRRLANKPAPEP